MYYYIIIKQKKIVFYIISSSIILILPNEQISHFRFKISLNIHKNFSYYISKNSKLANLLRETTFLIWDEDSIQQQYCFQSDDKLIQDVRSDKQLFGGLSIMLSDDFLQILLIIQYEI